MRIKVLMLYLMCKYRPGKNSYLEKDRSNVIQTKPNFSIPFLISYRKRDKVNLEVNGHSHPQESFIAPHRWLYSHSVVSKMEHCTKLREGLYTFEASGKNMDQQDSNSLREPTTLILGAALARVPAQTRDFTGTTLNSWSKKKTSIKQVWIRTRKLGNKNIKSNHT